MEPMTLGSPAGSAAQSPSSPATNFLPNFLLGDANPVNTKAKRNTTNKKTEKKIKNHCTFHLVNIRVDQKQLFLKFK